MATPGSTPVFNNGIFLRDTSYEATSNVDMYHMMNMLKSSEPQDMGPIEMWAMTKKVEMPLYQLSSFNGTNTEMVNDIKGEFKWQTPISEELPYITEDIEPNNVTKGIDGTTFKIKLSRREFGNGDIISYDKMNGVELFITHDDILPAVNSYIYTCRLVNNDNYKFLDNKFLEAGTRFFRKASARSGEYGETFANIRVQSGFREFYNFVGGAEAHAMYSVSTKAKLISDGYLNKNGSMPVVEIWRNFDQGLDPSIARQNTFNDYVTLMGRDAAKRAIESGSLRKTFLTKLEAAHLTKIAKDIENYIMWGRGGRIKQDGPDDMRLTMGLWGQLDNSFKRVYNKINFSLDIFRTELYNFWAGRVDFTGPNPERTIIVQTGMGGMQMVNEAIKREAIASGLIINASDVGAITNKSMDLNYGFAFTSYTIPFLANVKFVINPAFDNYQNNNIENPLIDGFPLSSYSFIIFDITDSGQDNFKLMKLGWDNELKWWYENGSMDYMGRTKGFQGAKFSGFRVYMSQTFPAIWVKDPTKVLKIVMKNPITGGSF